MQARAAMSATSLHHQVDPKPELRRARTRDTTSSSGRKVSPNRVKSNLKPANQAVIAGIISSLDAFDTTPTALSSSNSYYSRNSKRGGDSTPRSASASVASSPSIARSSFMPPSETTTYGTVANDGTQWDISEEEDDAAPPPVIAASPSISSMSQQSTRASRRSMRSESHYTPSLHSLQRSPVAPKREPIYPAHRNLSAESWIKQNIQQSLESAHARKNPAQAVRENPIRSEDAERQHLAACAVKHAHFHRTISGEVRRKASPPPNSSKSRVYIDSSDSTDDKMSGPPTPKSLSIRTKSSESYSDAIKQAPTSLAMSPRSSARASPMADSIPLRTSSLRQSSSSPAPMRKKKLKNFKKQIINSNPFVSNRSEAISDTSFLDLGEEDETVKRIMELRKKRQTRLLESSSVSMDGEIGVPSLKLTIGKNTNEPMPARPIASRSATEPARTSDTLGMTVETPILYDLEESPALGATYFPESSPYFEPLSPSTEPLSPHSMPATASTSPHLSLDYSYAQAVHALHSARRPSMESRRPSIEAAMPNVPFRRGSATTAMSVGKTSSLKVPSLKQTQSQRSSESRWAHPDLPDEFVKKSRRQSVSDARLAKAAEERLQMERRDSVEDAVLGFLRAQRLNQKIRHIVSGRTISFSEVGDPKGSAVFVCVGMGLTRFVTAFYDELAITLRLRLVTIERPGVGDSDGYPPNDRSGPLNWPNDVLTVCDHLGIETFSLLAHSAGAVYALATALVLPHMVKGKVHLLAPWIPPSQMEVVSHPSSASSSSPGAVLPRSQRLLRVLPTPFLRAANSTFMASATASLGKSANKRKPSGAGIWPSSPDTAEFPRQGAKRPTTSDGDRPDFHRRESLLLMDQYMPNTNPMENFMLRGKTSRANSPHKRDESLFMSATATPADPAFTYASTALNAAEHSERERQVIYTSRLTQRTWEYAIRDSNPATDLLVCLERHRQVGFRYTDVTAAVIITHGAEDKRVPVNNVRWLGDQMNRNMASPASRGGAAGSPRDLYDQEMGGGGCEVRVLEDEGHGLMASPTIMGNLLTEISGYWR
jgi:pimeloyl-ACP methyl ester carboxylesterase